MNWEGALCIDRWLEFDLGTNTDPYLIHNAIATCHQCPLLKPCRQKARDTKAKEVIQGGIAWGEDGRRLPIPKAENFKQLLLHYDPRIARSWILAAGKCRAGHTINDSDDLAFNGKQGVRCRQCLRENRAARRQTAKEAA